MSTSKWSVTLTYSRSSWSCSHCMYIRRSHVESDWLLTILTYLSNITKKLPQYESWQIVYACKVSMGCTVLVQVFVDQRKDPNCDQHHDSLSLGAVSLTIYFQIATPNYTSTCDIQHCLHQDIILIPISTSGKDVNILVRYSKQREWNGWAHKPGLTHLSLVCSRGFFVVLCILYQQLITYFTKLTQFTKLAHCQPVDFVLFYIMQ